ncbi:MAG: hypothetical protein JW732_05270 [Dehalococcoidia bacterium]|nr:hypothetical protein [Dehalococcoidia bacterium]
MIEIPDINSDFIKEWESNYYKEDPDAKRDEKDYVRLINLAKQDIKTDTISLDTLMGILDWKDYKQKRLKRFVTKDFWDREDFWQYAYEPRFRPITSRSIDKDYYLKLLIWDKDELSQRFPPDVLDKLKNVKEKAKGFGIPVASTALHFIFPTEFPIMDVRIAEMLYLVDKTNSVGRDAPEKYEQFRVAMLITQKETGHELHKIDRALFYFHKKKLQDELKDIYKKYSRKFNPGLSTEEIGKGPGIGADVSFRRLLIDIIKCETRLQRQRVQLENQELPQAEQQSTTLNLPRGLVLRGRINDLTGHAGTEWIGPIEALKPTEGENGLWEFLVTSEAQYSELSRDTFPVTTGPINPNPKGILVTLSHGEHKCEASLHRHPGNDFYISSANKWLGRKYTEMYRKFVKDNGLTRAKGNPKVNLVFEGYTVHILSKPGPAMST